MNYNKVFVLGNLTRDPEIRTTNSGSQVASFGVATNRHWNDKDGQRQSEVEFHNITAWGRLAEIAGQYLKKGQIVFVEGRLKTQTWEDKEGNKKSKVDIIAEGFQMGPGGDRSNQSNEPTEEPPVVDEPKDIKSPDDVDI